MQESALLGLARHLPCAALNSIGLPPKNEPFHWPGNHLKPVRVHLRIRNSKMLSSTTLMLQVFRHT
jgi:hypothetical protein